MKRRDFSLAAASLGLLPLVATPRMRRRHACPRPAPTTSCSASPRRSIRRPARSRWSSSSPTTARIAPPSSRALDAWVKKLPPHVAFRRVPVPFVGNDIETKQRLYYTLEAMGKVDEFQMKLFQAIHQQRQTAVRRRRRARLGRQAAGPGRQEVRRDVQVLLGVGKAKRATQLTNDYQVGRRAGARRRRPLVCGRRTAGSLDRALQITDFLIGEARKG